MRSNNCRMPASRVIPDEIKQLQDAGFEVEHLAPNMYRICGTLDLYPNSGRRFIDLRTRETGDYPAGAQELKEFVVQHTPGQAAARWRQKFHPQ